MWTLVLLVAVLIVVLVVALLLARTLAEGAAGAALTWGLMAAIGVWWYRNWGVALLAFFFATLVGFGVAYVCGLVLSAFGAIDYPEQEAVNARVSDRRHLIGGIGGVLIGAVVLFFLTLGRSQSGEWANLPIRTLLGFAAFFILGAVTVVALLIKRRKKPRDAS